MRYLLALLLLLLIGGGVSSFFGDQKQAKTAIQPTIPWFPWFPSPRAQPRDW